MEHEDAVWTEAAVAPDQVVAEMWQEYLADQEVPSMLEPSDVVSFLGVSGNPVRLLVPEDLLEEAQRLIDEFEDESIDPEALAAEAEAAAPEPGEAAMIEAVAADLEAEDDEDFDEDEAAADEDDAAAGPPRG